MRKKLTLKVENYSKDSDEIKVDSRFDEDLPIGTLKFVSRARYRSILVAPFIYAMFVPALFMDFCVTLFQWICFPIYDIRRVNRGEFFVFDRHKLHYLNGAQKLNCALCSYFNSVVSYTQEVASLTEERFCPIRHKFSPKRHHKRYDLFSEYSDAEGFRAKLRARHRNTMKQEKQ